MARGGRDPQRAERGRRGSVCAQEEAEMKKVRLPSRKALGAYATEVFARLKGAHPDAHCELDHDTPLQLLIATILSAQCTDKRVNMVTPLLFQRYPTAAALADASQDNLEEIIKSTGFFR